MFYFSDVELERRIRVLRRGNYISEDLRGWRWDSEKLIPPIDDFLVGVSEVANAYCPVRRDIYLSRVLGVKAPITFKTVRGWVYHEVSARTLVKVKELLYRVGLKPGYRVFKMLDRMAGDLVKSVMRDYNVSSYISGDEYRQLYRDGLTLYRFLALKASARIDEVISTGRYLSVDSLVSKVVPTIVERVVDGSLIGLSRSLRVDMLLDNNIIVDIKTGDVRDFHKYALAGYALAIEADMEKPVDIGVITYINIDGGFVHILNDYYFIGDELRLGFLEMRNRVMDLIHDGVDPGKPAECPSYCIYYTICNGGGDV